MLLIFFNWQGVMYKEFVPEGQTLNSEFYREVMV
jgi:Transposase.